MQHVEHEEQPLQQCMVASIMLACKGTTAESTIPFLDELSTRIAKWAKVAHLVVDKETKASCTKWADDATTISSTKAAHRYVKMMCSPLMPS